MTHGFFSAGAVLARVWKPRYGLLPWALTSALLTVAAMWDFWDRRGPIDYTLLGLSAYELMIGLLATEPAPSTSRARSGSAPPPSRVPRAKSSR